VLGDAGGPDGRWDRAELQRAHDHYVTVANQSARSGDWGPWADLFTQDAEYIEHHFGRFRGRQAILEWITTTMATWPNNEMTMFPHDWCVCDVERGRWICQIQNRFNDPGDGQVYQASNITILQYAGDMQFSSEEDVYNPAAFAPVVSGWVAAKQAHSSEPSG
jgi:SnoaL-like domain